MTKKDYIRLAEVFKRDSFNRIMTNTIPYNTHLESAKKAYFALLKKLTIQLKADNPRFNADKFMQAIG